MIDLTILHTNDVHAEYEAWLKCASLIKRRRKELGLRHCLVLDAGDNFDLGVKECGLSGGRLNLELLSELRLDAFTPGNNEFFRISRDDLARLSLESGFPWVLSTVSQTDGSAFAGFRKAVTLERGIKVGILGALVRLDNAAEILHGLKTLDFEKALPRTVQQLRAGGAQIIILLSHCGLNWDLQTAADHPGLFDVIVGGHSHSTLPQPRRIGQTLIVQAGGFGEYVGELQLKIDHDRIVDHHYLLHPTGELTNQDPAQSLILEKYRHTTEKTLNEQLCVLTEDLSQTMITRLLARLLRRKFQAEIGIMFGPGASDGLRSGPLRIGDLYEISRSFISPASFEISGKQIRGLIRERTDPKITAAPGFGLGFRPQGQAFGKLAFAGLVWQENGEHSPEIEINGRPLEPKRWYTAGSVTHLYSSAAGGYPSLDGSRNIKPLRFRYVRDELIDFFRGATPKELATLTKEETEPRP